MCILHHQAQSKVHLENWFHFFKNQMLVDTLRPLEVLVIYYPSVALLEILMHLLFIAIIL